MNSPWFRPLVLTAGVVVAGGCARPVITSPSTARGQVGAPFDYQIQATRQPTSFSASVPPPGGLSVDTASGRITGVPTEAGNFDVRLSARRGDREGRATLQLSVTEASPPETHAVVSGKELFITAPAVLNSPHATATSGTWNIHQALQRVAGPGVDVNRFAEAWFTTWADNDSVVGTGDRFTRRPWVADALRQAWRENRIKLIAIVNRIDLTSFPGNDTTQPPSDVGEGRFVYEVVERDGTRLPFTIIFEYSLPMVGDARAALTRWAQRWHALGRSALGDPNTFPDAYLNELIGLTDEYSAHGQLNQIRSNEFLPVPGGGNRLWELREFHFANGPARLQQVPIAFTPRLDRANSPDLAAFITAREAQLVGGAPAAFGPDLQGAVAPVQRPDFRFSPSGAPPRAAFITSFNTCSGCHAGDTGTLFQHVGVNAPSLSPFLQGSIPIAEPLPPERNTRRAHDEMGERRRLLAELAGDTASLPLALDAAPLSEIFRARAGRPH